MWEREIQNGETRRPTRDPNRREPEAEDNMKHGASAGGSLTLASGSTGGVAGYTCPPTTFGEVVEVHAVEVERSVDFCYPWIQY